MSKDIWEKESRMEPQAEKIGQRLTAAHQSLPAEARELSLGHEPGRDGERMPFPGAGNGSLSSL